MGETRPVQSVMRGLAAGAGIAAAAYATYVGITWRRYGHVAPSSGDEVDALLDRFIPAYDVAVRHHTDIGTPAEIALAAANTIDIQRSALVRALFKGRALILRGDVEQTGRPRTLLPWMRSLGWTVLDEIQGRAVVVGIVTRPWEPTPTPPAVPPAGFAAFHEPGYVKIVTTWTAEPLGPGASRFTIATRVATTDASARRHFRRYWAVFSPGSLLIRFIGLGFITGEAERRARAATAGAEPSARARGKAYQPQEIAEGVYRLSIRGSNVYFVRSGASWVLIDTAWANSERVIQQAAEALFGAGSRPAAILLTHAHPDHDGAAPELARLWDVPVYLHPDELPMAAGDKTAIEAHPAGPLDRWVVLPLMRVMPPRVHDAIRARGAAFMEVARPLDPGADIPGLPGWECVPTPGHSPGHVAFFRASDRVLIAGDAVLTVNLNSVWDLLRNKQRVSGPPYISTWNWRAAKVSVGVLARLEPRVLACGHGAPMTSAATAAELRAFADQLSVHVEGADAENEASDMSKEPLVGASLVKRLGFFLDCQLERHSVGLGVWLYRLTDGRIAHLFKAPAEVLILTTRGRKSGKERIVLLQGFRDGADLIVAAANSGQSSNPAWYYNLKATPQARIELMGRASQVRAEELPADEAAAFWPRILQIAPTYARYQGRTSRAIPLMRLVPTQPDGESSKIARQVEIART